MVRPREYVEAPPVTPLPFGLLSVALVVDDLTGHRQMGIQYEPAACGAVHDSAAACSDVPDFGSLTVAVNNARVATLTAAGNPDVTYLVEWGDGNTTAGITPLTGVNHTYTADGSYTITVSDDEGLGYHGQVTLTVTNGQVVAATSLAPAFRKVATDGIPLVEGDPVNLYHLFRCNALGIADGEARARQSMSLGEPRGIERITARQLSTAGAVDLTGDTPRNVVDAVALLEDYTASTYGGVPVLHMARGVGTVAAALGAIGREGNRLETKQGALIASGGGYGGLLSPAGDTPAAGTAWIYATGQVMVRRAPQADVVGPVMSRTPATNTALYLVERPVIVAWECVTAAVQVQTPYGIPAVEGFGL